MDRVIELINYSGPFQITRESVRLSLPEVSHVTANTLVRVQGLLRSGVYGDHGFRYNRMDLDGIRQREIIVTANETTVDSLLPLLNVQPIFTYTIGSNNESLRKQGLLRLEDIVNESIVPVTAGDSTVITVKASPHSYLFTGALSVKLTRL